MCVDWNAVSAIATIFATCVALYASIQARNELKSALKIQEQSKNLGLLDKRIELVEKIRSDKSVSEWTLRVLFDYNADIIKHHTALQEWKFKEEKAQEELNILSAKGGFREEQVLQEHPELDTRITNARENAEREKLETLRLLEKFIADSIKPIE